MLSHWRRRGSQPIRDSDWDEISLRRLRLCCRPVVHPLLQLAAAVRCTAHIPSTVAREVECAGALRHLLPVSGHVSVGAASLAAAAPLAASLSQAASHSRCSHMDHPRCANPTAVSLIQAMLLHHLRLSSFSGYRRVPTSPGALLSGALHSARHSTHPLLLRPPLPLPSSLHSRGGSRLPRQALSVPPQTGAAAVTIQPAPPVRLPTLLRFNLHGSAAYDHQLSPAASSLSYSPLASR